ncbi:MAG: hypothetical protein MR991_03430 [Clostridiales bacterium]|nr:hypothetical protein [Clostridiales bacterium]
MNRFLSKGLIKYGLVVIMVTLALVAYLKPAVEEKLADNHSLKIGVAGSQVVKYSEDELMMLDDENLKSLVEETGIRGYSRVEITGESKDVTVSAGEVENIRINVDEATGASIIVDTCEGKSQILTGVRSIQFR